RMPGVCSPLWATRRRPPAGRSAAVTGEAPGDDEAATTDRTRTPRRSMAPPRRREWSWIVARGEGADRPHGEVPERGKRPPPAAPRVPATRGARGLPPSREYTDGI